MYFQHRFCYYIEWMCATMQRRLHRTRRRHVYGMRHRQIQNGRWNGGMHGLSWQFKFTHYQLENYRV